MIKKVTMSNINSKDHQDFYDFIHGKKTETKQPTIHTAQEYDLPPVKPRPRPVQKKYPLYEDEETYRHPPVRQAPPKPVEPVEPVWPVGSGVARAVRISAGVGSLPFVEPVP